MADLHTITLPHEDYGRQLYVSKNRPAYADFQSVENRRGTIQKPTGGLWTSTWTKRPDLSAWVRWSAMEDFFGEGEKGWVIDPSPGSRIVVVNSVADYEALVEEYPTQAYPDKVTAREETVLDFEAISDDFNAMWLTGQGQQETRYYRERGVESLYGWDVESTLWFDWRVNGVEPIGEIRWKEHPDYRPFDY